MLGAENGSFRACFYASVQSTFWGRQTIDSSISCEETQGLTNMLPIGIIDIFATTDELGTGARVPAPSVRGQS